MTHLLPGGEVSRVHRARSPVPPRLPHFATPRSVHRLAAVAAGAYPSRRPPYAWSPGVPAPPGPCYWLVASGTPVGWRGGCLAVGLVRGAVRHYCLGGCSALVVCARRSRPVHGVWGQCRVLCLPRSPFPPCVSRAVCGRPCRPGVPYPRSLVRHSMRSVRPAGSIRLPFWYSPHVLCVCARSRSRGVRPTPRPLVGVARAPRAVLVLGAGRTVPRGLCPSACPASVPCSVWLACRGGGPVPFPPYLASGCALPVGWVCVSGAFQRRGVGVGGGGGRPARRPPQWCGRGGQWGGGSPYLGSSLCLPWAGNKAGVFGVALAMEGVAPIPLGFLLACCAQGRSVWRPCALARVCLSIAVPAGAGGWGRGGGPCCAPPPGRRGPSGGWGGPSPLPWGGWGARGPVARGSLGGSGETGGGVAPWFSSSLPRGGAAFGPLPRPPLVAGACPPGVRVRPGSWGSPGRRARPAAGGSAWRGGGGGGGAACDLPSPEEWPGGLAGRGDALPRSVPLSSLGGQQSGRQWGRSGHGGRGPHTAPVSVRVLPPGVVRVPSLCAGAGSPACRGRRQSRQWGAWGRAARGLSCVPPRATRPLQGVGGRPLCLRGWTASAPVARRPEGGVEGRGEGGSRRGLPPPCPGGVARGPRPSPTCSPARHSCGYMFSRGCRAAPGAGRGLAGRRWVSLAGRGRAASAPYPRGLARGAPRGGEGGGLFAAVCSPAFSGRARRRVASSVPRPPCCIPG